jgi:hypothetical protein
MLGYRLAASAGPVPAHQRYGRVGPPADAWAGPPVDGGAGA